MCQYLGFIIFFSLSPGPAHEAHPSSKSLCLCLRLWGLLHLLHLTTGHHFSEFTTRTPAVPDVLGSGRNVGALRPGRHVGFR